jgi:NDP-sugar pyrophosphorylase family protein
MIAVIQAGGKGTRLQPYTFVMPKPLMPVGDLPVLEILLIWLRRWGVKKTFITTGYLGHLIRSLCSNGKSWDMEISFSQEPEPLGTIGGLSLLVDQLRETFVTVNGDLITNLNLHDFVSYHRRCRGLLTVGVTEKIVNIDMGVLESNDGLVMSFREKPDLRFKVSMGIYCMEPDILKLVPRGIPFGFDDLVHEMLSQGLPIYVYEHEGLWMDIGREEDFRRAQNSFLKDYKSVVLGC